MYKHILIATDGSSLSTRGVEQGTGLAKALDAAVSVVTVSERFHVFSLDAEQLEETEATYKQHVREQSQKILEDALRISEASGLSATPIVIEDDEPYRAIIRTAEGRGCDLIVMASHGRGGVSALLLGSETMKVLTHSKIPVLVVH